MSATIYIPRMSTSWTESSVRDVLRKNFIGIVSHVDFTPINKKCGFSEDVCSGVMSAFVHFSDPVHIADSICVESEKHWDVQFWTNITEGAPYKLQVNRHEYWVCLKNTHPVKRTRMNIHQVVENCRHLEGLVASQAEEIATLKKSLVDVTDSVYQLIGGLFNQHTQRGPLSHALKRLGVLGASGDDVDPQDSIERGESQWPTTRQGDENSIQIRNLEQSIRFQWANVDDIHRRLSDQEITVYRRGMLGNSPPSLPEGFPGFSRPHSPITPHTETSYY